jgi:hypothetical protein
VNRTSAGVSGPEVVAVNEGREARVTRAAEGRGDIVNVGAGDVGIVAPDVPFDAEAAAGEDGAIEGATAGARLVAAPQAVSIATLARKANASGTTRRG